jgi:hypothetical protein
MGTKSRLHTSARDAQLAFESAQPDVEDMREKLFPEDLNRSGLLQSIMESCPGLVSPLRLPMRRADWIFWREAASRVHSMTQPELVHLITVRERSKQTSCEA